MSRSPDRRPGRRSGVGRGLVALVIAAGLCGGASPSLADDTPSASSDPTASPTAPATVASSPAATATSLAGLSAPVYDIATTVESLDGKESQETAGNRQTLILDSRVLFAVDRAVVTPAARARLRAVARQIRQAGATGTVRVAGYTDDQGSAQHGLVLSRQRADAVRGVLGPLLASTGVTLTTRGFGEADPRFPNTDRSGRPIPANQARNRRVEISFTRASG